MSVIKKIKKFLYGIETTRTFGNRSWYSNNIYKCHRDYDLPAWIFSNGYKEYWINGDFIGE